MLNFTARNKCNAIVCYISSAYSAYTILAYEPRILSAQLKLVTQFTPIYYGNLGRNNLFFPIRPSPDADT